MQRKRLSCVLLVSMLLTISCLVELPINNWLDEIFSENGSSEENLGKENVTAEIVLAWQEDIDQLQALFRSLSIPANLIEDNSRLLGDEFDVMAIFDILDRLWIEEGYKLAYVYKYDYIGGYPVLYIHAADQKPYATYGEFYSERIEGNQEGSKPTYGSYRQYVHTDGSELGYLQLILLYKMGNQFYLYWHSGYKDITYVATKAGVDEIIRKLEDNFTSLTSKQAIQAKRIDPTPKIFLEEEVVSVRVVYFTKWGGFYEIEHTINKDFPHLISDSTPENLVEYDCDIMF